MAATARGQAGTRVFTRAKPAARLGWLCQIVPDGHHLYKECLEVKKAEDGSRGRKASRGRAGKGAGPCWALSLAKDQETAPQKDAGFSCASAAGVG